MYPYTHLCDENNIHVGWIDHLLMFIILQRSTKDGKEMSIAPGYCRQGQTPYAFPQEGGNDIGQKLTTTELCKYNQTYLKSYIHVYYIALVLILTMSSLLPSSQQRLTVTPCFV